MNTLKVLVADDHEGFRRSLSDFLRAQQGVEIVGEAGNGSEAVEMADRLHPDLVLMDLDMPERDGFEATRRIKNIFPHARVIILSIHGDDAYRETAWEYSADGFIDKSSMKAALLTLVRDERERLAGTSMDARVALPALAP